MNGQPKYLNHGPSEGPPQYVQNKRFNMHVKHVTVRRSGNQANDTSRNTSPKDWRSDERPTQRMARCNNKRDPKQEATIPQCVVQEG